MIWARGLLAGSYVHEKKKHESSDWELMRDNDVNGRVR